LNAVTTRFMSQLAGVRMKNILIASIVCVGITYTLDAYFLNGKYYRGLGGMMSSMARHMR
jgi:hypothetical protein